MKKVIGTKLTNAERKEICEMHVKNPSMTQQELGAWAVSQYKLEKPLTQGAISKILKRKSDFLGASGAALHIKRHASVSCPALDAALATWVLQCQQNKVSITGDVIKAKARRFATLMKIPEEEHPTFSTGWLCAFQKRHRFKSFKQYGEASSAPADAVYRGRQELIDIINNFDLKDVYNIDETGLFFRMAPDRTISQVRIPGKKKNKERVTILLGCNADGSEKLKLFYIGKSKQPRCFQKKSAKQLGFSYTNNKKAWMTSLVFRDWILHFDKEKRQQNRQVLLLMDNASSHFVSELNLTNTTVEFLPPNTTSILQPIDAGICAAFKRRYRKMQMEYAIHLDEMGERDIYNIDLLRAMRWSEQAWYEITDKTIHNCWQHTGLIARENRDKDYGKELETELNNELTSMMKSLRITSPLTIDELLNPEGENEVHAVLSDEAIAEGCLESGIDVPDDDDEPDSTNTIVISDEEKIKALTTAWHVIDELTSDFSVMRSLKKARSMLQESQRKALSERYHQTSIRTLFSSAQ
jgi:hypothetical protein